MLKHGLFICRSSSHVEIFCNFILLQGALSLLGLCMVCSMLSFSCQVKQVIEFSRLSSDQFFCRIKVTFTVMKCWSSLRTLNGAAQYPNCFTVHAEHVLFKNFIPSMVVFVGLISYLVFFSAQFHLRSWKDTSIYLFSYWAIKNTIGRSNLIKFLLPTGYTKE